MTTPQVLSRQDVGRGLEALYHALGPDKARVFLDLVASGALDPNLMNRLQAFVRRNPEVITAGASLLGGLFAGLLATQTAKRKGDSGRALKLLREGIAQALEHGQRRTEEPPVPVVIDVGVVE